MKEFEIFFYLVEPLNIKEFSSRLLQTIPFLNYEQTLFFLIQRSKRSGSLMTKI